MESMDGKVIPCQFCYEKAFYYQNQHGHTLKTEEYKCESCKTEVELYEKDGKRMMKCAGCASEGIRCSMCKKPPKSSG